MTKVHKIYQTILSKSQAQKADAYTIEANKIASIELMEKAGNAICGAALKMVGFHKQSFDKNNVLFFILCGPGNNGGDGFICARRLWELNIPSLVLSIEDPVFLKGEAQDAFLKFSNFISENDFKLPNKKHCLEIVRNEEQIACFLNTYLPIILIDALHGTGLNKPLCGKSAMVANLINDWRYTHPHDFKVLAVDIPSGLCADGNVLHGPYINADATITFSYRKITHVSEPNHFLCGDVFCKNIGIQFPKNNLEEPPALTLLEQSQPARSLLKPIQKTSYKSVFGHIAIHQGSLETKGASRLAARAALRAGAGLVTLLVPDMSLSEPYDLPEFMKRSFHNSKTVNLNDISVLVLGPGLIDEQSKNCALSILETALKIEIPIVLDAGGLTLLPKIPIINSKSVIIATPHPGEAAKLLGISSEDVQNDRLLAMKKLTTFSSFLKNRVIWVLKGACPIVSEQNNKTVICEGGIPLLSIPGSGDVLSGLIAGLIKQTNDPFDAAILAVSTHLAVGRYLQQIKTRGYLASEIADTIPQILYATH